MGSGKAGRERSKGKRSATQMETGKGPWIQPLRRQRHELEQFQGDARMKMYYRGYLKEV